MTLWIRFSRSPYVVRISALRWIRKSESEIRKSDRISVGFLKQRRIRIRIRIELKKSDSDSDRIKKTVGSENKSENPKNL